MRITCFSVLVVILATLRPVPAAAQQCEQPNMMITLDKSGSMADNNKWTQAKAAVQYILNNYNVPGSEMLQFGLTLFASDALCGVGTVVEDLGATSAAIMSHLNISPVGGTPIAATLAMLNSYQPLKDPNRRNFVMLITDGEEFCASNLDDAVSSAADLLNNGIRTFVIGFGAGVDPGVLNAIAAAGDTNHYYSASNQSDLQTVMSEIINQALVEVCDDRDNDCDDLTDEPWPLKGTVCSVTNPEGTCTAYGVWVCNATQDGLDCTAQIVPSQEVCDGTDNDCDGTIDNGFPDLDADGYLAGGPEATFLQCQDCCDSGNEPMTGCTAATAPAINPGATEVCNGYDDNCNGVVDEGDPDMGTPCGEDSGGEDPPYYTDEGDCQPGLILCVDGSLTCVGEINPIEEILCDGRDNDCDGEDDDWAPEICDDGIDNDCDDLIDVWDPDCGAECFPGEVQPCGTDEGDCEMGVQICQPDGTWGDCEGGVGPQPEVCDDRDNDCDGLTDEDAVPEICDNGIDDDCDGLIDAMDPDCGECTPGDSRECGTNVGECQTGIQICNAYGQWGECAGMIGPEDEECDGLDNDCDGLTDEGNLCEGYSICLCGECAPPCSAGECPASNKYCINDWCVSDPCCGVFCPPGELCRTGACIDLCEEEPIQCGAEEECRMGICVPVDCFTEGQECPGGQQCVEGACQSDPCSDVDCPADQYCREGTCQNLACLDCSDEQVCEEGECVDSACADVHCNQGRICVDGECAADPCQGVYCPAGFACQNGNCVGDPCLNITCPEDSVCQDGYCLEGQAEPDGGVPDAGPDEDGGQDAGSDSGPADEVSPDAGPGDQGPGADTGGGNGGDDGCGCSSRAPAGTGLLGLLVLLAGLGLRRSRPTL